MKKHVVVAISGGVDSATAAYLLKKQDFLVEGLFMKNWEEKNNACNIKKDLNDAKKICNLLNIKLHIINFSYEYWNNVFKNFILKYKAGETPNPDILCNQKIKFKILLQYIKNNLKADFMATGHYANIYFYKNQFHLNRGCDQYKDQSYFLYSINKKFLKYIIFPLGKYNKHEVRYIAKKNNIHNYNKKDSMGICFVGKRKFSIFIKSYIKKTKGYIKTNKNKILGTHDGLFNYTIGQRKGIKIKFLIPNNNIKPWYVIKKKIKTNELIVSQGLNNKYLFKKMAICIKINLLNIIKKKYMTCNAKIRNQQKIQLCIISTFWKNKFLIIFKKKQKAIAIGQSIVLYKNNICIGGGIIQKAI